MRQNWNPVKSNLLDLALLVRIISSEAKYLDALPPEILMTSTLRIFAVTSQNYTQSHAFVAPS